eukprot:201324_1
MNSTSAYKAMKCVFLAYIKHLGFDNLLYKWSRNEFVDKKWIDFMGYIWKYSCLNTCKILREREDFRMKKVKIKNKWQVENKGKDIKVILEEFKKKRDEDRKKDDNDEKKDEEKDKNKDKKIYKGICKEFDVDGGVGIITVENEDFNEIKVDKMEIFGYNNNKTLLVGEVIEFEIIEKDNIKIVINCTGVNGQYVVGITDDNITEELKQENKEDVFDGFERG